MSEFTNARLDQMLQLYGDKAVREAIADAAENGNVLDPYEIDSVRHAGECRAWLEHDAHFVWRTRLSNTFAELKQFIAHESLASFEIQDWRSLRAATVNKVVRFLARLDYPPCPPLFPTDTRLSWWQFVAIIHECDQQLRW